MRNEVSIREVRRYSEALKRQVVEEVESGRVTVKEAMEWYDVPWRRTIDRWRAKYSNERRGTKIVRIVMKDEKERIKELEKLVADLNIENRVKGAQLEIWEERYGEDLKKKLSTKELEEYEKRKALLKSL
jgi:transposase-like protein